MLFVMARDPLHPFGTPEGARADLSQFITFEGARQFGGLATRGSDLSARVFVGAKGAGKTIYLRRQHAAASEDPALYFTNVQRDCPANEPVMEFTDSFEGPAQVQAWSRLWRRAITRALVSHILHSSTLLEAADPEDVEALKEEYTDLLGRHRVAMTIYSQAAEILEAGYFRGPPFRGFLADARWNEIDSLVARNIQQSRPICFFLDALDDGFEAAPRHWLPAQLGLFITLMQLLQDPDIGGRLHITMGMRDLVYAAALQSEHATRYMNEPHIRILEWTSDAIARLLEEKIDRLEDEYLLRPGADSLIERWLGTSTVENIAFSVQEPMLQYIIRHTRSVPRDIIQVGNALSQTVEVARNEGLSAVPDHMIRDTVHQMARAFGYEQLKICANQIGIDMMPSTVTRRGHSSSYLGNTAYERGLAGTLRNLVRETLSDRFESSALDRFTAAGQSEFGEGIDVASVLWQNGLLGYATSRMDDGDAIFHSAAMAETFLIPRHKARYLIHPCLVDAVDGLNATGRKPIKAVAYREAHDE